MSLERNGLDSGNIIEKNIPIEPVSLEPSETEEVPEGFEANVLENIQSISSSCDTFNSDTEVSLNLARNSFGPEVETDQVENDTGVCAELAALDTKARECASGAVLKLSEHAKAKGIPKRNIANLLKPFRNVAAAAMIALSMPSQDLEAKESNLPATAKARLSLIVRRGKLQVKYQGFTSKKMV